MHDSGDVYHFTAAGRLTEIADRNDNTTTFSYSYGAAVRRSRPTWAPTAPAPWPSTPTGSGGQIDGAVPVTVRRHRPRRRLRLRQQRPADRDHRRARPHHQLRLQHRRRPDLDHRPRRRGDHLRLRQRPPGHLGHPALDAPGDAVTRLVYNAGQTLVADPNTDQGQAVAAVPHTTYDLTDTDGCCWSPRPPTRPARQRSATYTPFFDVADLHQRLGHHHLRLHRQRRRVADQRHVGRPAPAAPTPTATPRPTQYLPDTRHRRPGQHLHLHLRRRRQLPRHRAPPAPRPTSPATATAPSTPATAPSGAMTDYSYNTGHQLTGITPPAGNSLGNRSYTYDAYGRIATYTSGREHHRRPTATTTPTGSPRSTSPTPPRRCPTPTTPPGRWPPAPTAPG